MSQEVPTIFRESHRQQAAYSSPLRRQLLAWLGVDVTVAGNVVGESPHLITAA
jgi:hypothetical protein